MKGRALPTCFVFKLWTSARGTAITSSPSRPRRLTAPASACFQPATMNGQDQQDTRLRPSDLILEVTRGGGGGELAGDMCATPRIIEFLNLEDNSSVFTSSVRLDEPLFQPFPSKVIFEGYEAFGQQEKVCAL